MGYVAAFSKHDSPPLAFILTKESLEVMVFPFVIAGIGTMKPQGSTMTQTLASILRSKDSGTVII